MRLCRKFAGQREERQVKTYQPQVLSLPSTNATQFAKVTTAMSERQVFYLAVLYAVKFVSCGASENCLEAAEDLRTQRSERSSG